MAMWFDNVYGRIQLQCRLTARSLRSSRAIRSLLVNLSCIATFSAMKIKG